MTHEELAELLAAGRRELAQALRQWKMYADEKRADYHELGYSSDLDTEDRYYNTGLDALKRLGAAADELEDARRAGKPAFVCSAWLDLLAAGWQAEAELIADRLAHNPFERRAPLSVDEATGLRVHEKVYLICAAELRAVVASGLASKSNDQAQRPALGGKDNREKL